MKIFESILSFLLIFVLVFVLAGWFLMPYLPPTPKHTITIFDIEYWTRNWAGALLGIILGVLSTWLTTKKSNRKTETTKKKPNL